MVREPVARVKTLGGSRLAFLKGYSRFRSFWKVFLLSQNVGSRKLAPCPLPRAGLLGLP